MGDACDDDDDNDGVNDEKVGEAGKLCCVWGARDWVHALLKEVG